MKQVNQVLHVRKTLTLPEEYKKLAQEYNISYSEALTRGLEKLLDNYLSEKGGIVISEEMHDNMLKIVDKMNDLVKKYNEQEKIRRQIESDKQKRRSSGIGSWSNWNKKGSENND